jgi:hypothetical protein
MQSVVHQTRTFSQTGRRTEILMSNYIQLSHHDLQPNSFDVEIPTEKLKRYKSPGTDQIPAELIQVW